jgi:hypothetical protein
MKEPCRRQSGSFRAYFSTREDAEAFAAVPANPAYHGDLPALCVFCDLYHLNRPEWLQPQLTHQDAALLDQMGIAGPDKISDDLKCANCGVEFRTGIDFLILPNGKMVCGASCMPQND